MTDTELTLSERIQRLGNPGISSHDVVAEDDVYDSEDYQAFGTTATAVVIIVTYNALHFLHIHSHTVLYTCKYRL